jgi:hypothetical protein
MPSQGMQLCPHGLLPACAQQHTQGRAFSVSTCKYCNSAACIYPEPAPSRHPTYIPLGTLRNATGCPGSAALPSSERKRPQRLATTMLQLLQLLQQPLTLPGLASRNWASGSSCCAAFERRDSASHSVGRVPQGTPRMWPKHKPAARLWPVLGGVQVAVHSSGLLACAERGQGPPCMAPFRQLLLCPAITPA